MSNLIEEIVIDSLGVIGGSVVTGEEIIYDDSVDGIPMPQVVIKKSEHSVDISFIPIEDADVVSTVGSSFLSKNLNYDLGNWKLQNVVHDFTFGEFFDNTDRLLSEIFTKTAAELTRFTPDYVSEIGDYNIIVEVGTSRGDRNSVQKAYGLKRQKYESVLRNILMNEESQQGNFKKTLFGLIVVGRDCVSTNLILTEPQVKELQMRFRVGLKIYEELAGSKAIDPEFHDASEVDKQLEQYFRKLDSLSETEIIKWNDSIKRSIDKSHKDSAFLQSHMDRWDEARIMRLISTQDEDETKRKIADILKTSLKTTISNGLNYEYCGEIRRAKSIEAHNQFEMDYIKQNEGNMFSSMKAMVNFPFLVMKPSEPSRVPSRGIRLNEAKFETVYDTLYYAGMLKSAIDPMYFPDHEVDLLEQFGWEFEASTTDEKLREQKTEIARTGTFNLDEITDRFLNSALSLVSNDVSEQKALAKDFKGKTSRYKAFLTDDDRFELAMKGVQGKGLTSKYIKGKANPNFNYELHEQRSNKPDWFHIRDTDTSDLDTLMQDVEFFKNITATVVSSAESLILWRSMMNQSRSYHGENFLRELEEGHFKWLSKTRLFLWCKLISDIGTEVDISLKQNCKKDDFIFKKLQDFNVWLLIKPTKKSEKIFFSVLFKSEDIEFFRESTVFKSVHKLFGGENFVYTNFISLTESKILNWVLTLPRMIGLFRFWTNFSSIKPYSENKIEDLSESHPDYISFYKNALPMLLLSLLLGLNDKIEMEEEITRTRYLVMESLSEWPIEPKPYKMTEKISKQMRSRLTVWLYRKHKELSHLYSYEPPKAKNEEVLGQGQTETSSQLFWEGFINPYTNYKLTSGQQVINLFYLGYIKNKDEIAQVNKASKLYDKILSYEIQYDEETAKILGISSPEQPRPHCFDIDLMLDCSNNLKRRILETNSDFNYMFAKNLHNFLFHKSVEDEFSTLKASSNFNEELFDRKKVTNKYQRAKVIEKLALEGEDSVTIAELFEAKYIKCLKSRGLNIDIFRKPQHGGDREIYVLGFQERVVQRVIEQIARSLCSFIPEETMTHPSNKITIPENNQRDAKARFRTGHVTLNSSADASKWSQNNSSFKLMMCLLILTPKYLHLTIIRCLRLWEFKRILINPRILELFDKHRELLFYDQTLQNMYDGYKGTKYFRWIQAGNPYIEVTTGMMQGILHYTSSLYHAAIISRVKEIAQQNTTKLKEILQIQTPFSLVMCHLESSDDSFFSVSAPVNSDDKFVRASKILATSMLQFKVDFSSHCGVVNSIKTTLCTNHVFEFNSNFEFGFNHYKPDIKAVLSGFLVSEQELLLSRQEELSVLLTTYIENGGTNYVANGLQGGQCYLHYHLLGMTTTRYFRTYEALNSILPDPSTGFFLMDNPLCPGLLGFKYSLWNTAKTTNLGKLYRHKLRPITLENDELEESVKLSIELSAHGSLSTTYKLVHGNRKKWLALLERMQVDMDWRSKVEQNPEIMFRRSLTNADVKIKISQKMHSPGVSSSLSSLNTIPRILAESAYILKLQAVTSLSNWIDPKKTEFSKVTLIEAILKDMKEVLSEEDITEQELKILFPFNDDFIKNQTLLTNLNITQIGQSFREYKRKETSVQIATNNEYNLVSLKGILLSFWFENSPDVVKPSLSREHRTFIFEQHQKVIPWIRKTVGESLLHSPFTEMVDMLLWLNTFSGRRRIVRLLGTQIISRHGYSRLLSVVINNLSSSHRLSLDNFEIERPDHIVAEVRSRLTLIAALPENNVEKARKMIGVLKEVSDRIVYVDGSVRSSQNDVVLMCKLAQSLGHLTKNPKKQVFEFIEDMKRNKHGVIGFFTTRQRVSAAEGGVSYYGLGVWEGLIDGFDVKIQINNDFGHPVQVESITTNTHLASAESISLRRFIDSMHWDIPATTRYEQGRLFLNDKGINATSGIPIFIVDEYSSNIKSYFELYLSMEWTGRNLRCLAHTKHGNPLTVMTFTPRSSYYNPITTYNSEERLKVNRLWLSNKSATKEEAAVIIKRINEFTEERKDMIRINLRAKLQAQGIVFKRQIDLVDLAFVSKQEEDFDYNDYLQFQLDDPIEGLDFKPFEVDIKPPEAIEMEDFDLKNIEDLRIDELLGINETNSYVEVLKREIWRAHPLFKTFANTLINQHGRSSINRLINQKEYTADLEGVLHVFEVILSESKDEWVSIRAQTLDELAGDIGDDIDSDEEL